MQFSPLGQSYDSGGKFSGWGGGGGGGGGELVHGLSRNASSVSFGQAEHCLTFWTPKSLCQNLLKMTFLRR